MEQGTIQILFALLRSAVFGTRLSEEDKTFFYKTPLSELITLSKKHDVTHLLAHGLKENGLIPQGDAETEKHIFKAIYRYEQINFEYGVLCSALEEAEIPFVVLKGSVLRRYYPQPWMRTSCDVDILVHNEDLERAISYLTDNLQYVKKERGTHDVSLYSPRGNHIEIHYDLVEEGRANNALDVLNSVWENVFLQDGSRYRYEMNDAFFYFYHIVHMAKHVETGGCGIRPFIDLWILDGIEEEYQGSRDELLSKCRLLQFANAVRGLSRYWLGEGEADDLTLQVQKYILYGGTYGSTTNRVMLHQSEKGGRVGYLVSRIFVPYDKLRRYYPILEKHRWLTPFMQVRRWFMLFKPDVAKMAKQEIATNISSDKTQANEMNSFLNKIGL
ncbi:MAG: nucleotidyltransferase family protein [Clostridia bacterium]|nr:nucleotidyltransferase family protein [Clostridia bacterium]